MSVEDISPQLRVKDVYHHIDMGFLNRRLCMTALPKNVRDEFIRRQKPGDDHFTGLANDHLLVTMLLDVCDAMDVPTLLEALLLGKPQYMFRSTERLAPCPQIYNDPRVSHDVLLDIDFGKPIQIAYHTEHLVSSTGKMTLEKGAEGGYEESIVGLLHDKGTHFEIEPLVIGAPWLDHQRNGDDATELMWAGSEFGEILPEDIDQFSNMKDVRVESAEEWLKVMQIISEETVKESFATLLHEPTKKDWGGEANDHFSSNVTLNGNRKTAAFLLKGPANFREMTLDMCGKRADQIYRLVNSRADISVIQHCHLISEPVRHTLRCMTFFPGHSHKYCLIDGQATYRILRANSFI